jgi:hypothetical protein
MLLAEKRDDIVIRLQAGNDTVNIPQLHDMNLSDRAKDKWSHADLHACYGVFPRGPDPHA